MDDIFAEAVQLIFRCSVCNEEKFSLENLEVHLWACHLRSFPYRCAKCGYPALNSKALIAHFSECHDASTQQVEFKRRIEHELRLRELISRSVVLPSLEEQVYCDDELLTEERRDKYVAENQSTVTRDSQLPRVVHPGDGIGAVDRAYESAGMADFRNNVAQEEIIEEAGH